MRKTVVAIRATYDLTTRPWKINTNSLWETPSWASVPEQKKNPVLPNWSGNSPGKSFSCSLPAMRAVPYTSRRLHPATSPVSHTLHQTLTVLSCDTFTIRGRSEKKLAVKWKDCRKALKHSSFLFFWQLVSRFLLNSAEKSWALCKCEGRYKQPLPALQLPLAPGSDSRVCVLQTLVDARVYV